MTDKKYTAFDNMLEGVQIIAPDWRYVYVNDAVVKHSKLTRNDLIGFTMLEKFPGIEKTLIFKSIQQCMATRDLHQMVDEFTFPDGSIGYFQLRMQPVDEGVLIYSFDITDQKTAEELIKRTNTELEEIIRQRIKELVEKTKIIEQQIQRLEELNSTKDKFFSIIAHDFKSPLNSLKGFATLLVTHIDKLSKPEIVDLSKQFENSIDNTIKMADNLITWATLQMKENETRLENVRVDPIVASTIELFKESARRKKITIDCSVEENLFVIADKNQVEFIVRNLLNNAIKFTNYHGKVTLKGERISNNKVQIVISDNGVGMTSEVKEKLFSINRKESMKGTDGESGTGLGLMLCSEFIRLNNGTINIESELDKGTTFFIELNQA